MKFVKTHSPAIQIVPILQLKIYLQWKLKLKKMI